MLTMHEVLTRNRKVQASIFMSMIRNSKVEKLLPRRLSVRLRAILTYCSVQRIEYSAILRKVEAYNINYGEAISYYSHLTLSGPLHIRGKAFETVSSTHAHSREQTRISM